MKVHLWWIDVGVLLFLLTYAVGDKSGNFTVEGDIVFPSTGDYSAIPADSCLLATVRNDIQCFFENCRIPVRGRTVMRNLNVVNNRLPYKVKCSGGVGRYAISVSLNVGWCGEQEGGGIHKGDYFNDYAVPLSIESSNKTAVRDVDLSYYSYESLASTSFTRKTDLPTTLPPSTTTERPDRHLIVAGSVVLPAKGVYTDIPAGSCLGVDIMENIQCESCDIPKVAYVKLNVTQDHVTGNRIKFSINAENIIKGDYYTITALFNVGWCSSEGGSEWLRGGDYFNDVSHTIYVPEDGATVVEKDIVVKEHQKYLCGKKQCYEKENCTRLNNSSDSYCACPPYACPCLIQPKWVCGSDGFDYSSECWMGATDCFSGTVYVKHKGKCIDPKFYRATNKAVGWLAGVSAACIIILFGALVVLKKNQRRSLQGRRISKKPIVFSDSIYGKEPATDRPDGDPIYESVQDVSKVILHSAVKHQADKPKLRVENIYVTAPRRATQAAPCYLEHSVSPPPAYNENDEAKVYGNV